MAGGNPNDDEIFDRIMDLSDNINHYLGVPPKPGVSYRLDSPARYFHIRTLAQLKSHSDFGTVFDDRLFFEYLYATLVAWRMDSGNAKLVGFNEFHDTIRDCRDSIVFLSGYRLNRVIDFEQDDIRFDQNVVSTLKDVLSRMRTSRTESQLVSNTKALHHLLPDLVPPVDRSYTLKFFFNKKDVWDNYADQFANVLRDYCLIYEYCHEQVDRLVDVITFNSSVVKTIDNAIMAYVSNKLAS